MQNCRAAPNDPLIPRYNEAPPDTRCTTLCIFPRWAPRRLGLKKPTTPTKTNTTPTTTAMGFAIASPYRLNESNCPEPSDQRCPKTRKREKVLNYLKIFSDV